MNKEILENHQRYLERKRIYLKYGVDVDKERKFILDNAKPISGNILEIGTGKGHFALTLAEDGHKFTSIDVSEEEQNIAKLNLTYFGLEKSVNFKIENAEHLSFKNNSFDIIFSINTVHHFSKPYKVMDESARILATEGKIILSDFNKKGFEILDKVHASEGQTHETAELGLSEMETYFSNNGFKIDRSEGEFQQILTIYKRTA
ncbi:MAG: class I SAM-dependent methyltransferase [Candidatus Omnitrophica bacterium]|nr:class I SAM-dependent methyltransferase [Candidatus Omnitrophota bacterium]